MATAFFIDFENVRGAGIEGLNEIEEDDVVYLFHGDNDSFPMRFLTSERFKNISFIKCNVGTKNAMDFQLISYMGYKLMDPYLDSFVVVSKDKGYDSTINFWIEKRFKIYKSETIKNGLKKAKKQPELCPVCEVVVAKDNSKNEIVKKATVYEVVSIEILMKNFNKYFDMKLPELEIKNTKKIRSNIKNALIFGFQNVDIKVKYEDSHIWNAINNYLQKDYKNDPKVLSNCYKLAKSFVKDEVAKIK